MNTQETEKDWTDVAREKVQKEFQKGISRKLAKEFDEKKEKSPVNTPGDAPTPTAPIGKLASEGGRRVNK